jgi:hypothetical protein
MTSAVGNVADDYLSYFFVRSKGANGPVATTPSTSTWAGSYDTAIKWGPSNDSWTPAYTLAFDGTGSVWAGDAAVHNVTWTMDALVWTSDGNQFQARVNLQQGNNDPNYFPSPVTVPCFTGAYQSGADGWLDFRGVKASSGTAPDPSTGVPANRLVVPRDMLAHARGPQLFKWAAVGTDAQYALIVNQDSQLALELDGGGRLILATPNPLSVRQQWAVTVHDQLRCAGAPDQVLSVAAGSYVMAPSDESDPNQKFEFLPPSDFTYIRNSWTGRYLTAEANNAASWQTMSPSRDDYQQWGITSDGFLVNRATARVLQLSAATPSPGLILNLGDQAPLGAGDAFQRFDVSAVDGAFHSQADPDYVIGKEDDRPILQRFSESDYTQLIELLSPFQFFSLQNGASYGPWNQHGWLERIGNGTGIGLDQTGRIDQSFTVSRYGELISPIDGFVLQSAGQAATPQFVDPEPEPIGFDTTTFVYGAIEGAIPGLGTITLRTGGLGLILASEHHEQVPMMWPVAASPGGNQQWQLVGPPDTVFSQYQDLARIFFARPAPLPGEQAALRVIDEETATLVPQLNKTTKVIGALILGALDIFAGITPIGMNDAAMTALAQRVLGNAEVAARIAAWMQEGITIASVISVVDGVTRAGIWWQILDFFIPNSFWGWTITIAKIGVSIVQWVSGVGTAIKGAKMVILVAQIVNIIRSDEVQVAEEVALLSTHVERLRSTAAVATD